MQQKIIFYDGQCGFCNRSVMWILRRDRNRQFCFASLQSELARKMLKFHPNSLHSELETLNSLVLLVDNDVYLRSDAVLKIAMYLPFPYFIARLFLIVPRIVRDSMYGWIAKHRYRLAGNVQTCAVLSDEERARFLS